MEAQYGSLIDEVEKEEGEAETEQPTTVLESASFQGGVGEKGGR
jgi:hypothetical protein